MQTEKNKEADEGTLRLFRADRVYRSRRATSPELGVHDRFRDARLQKRRKRTISLLISEAGYTGYPWCKYSLVCADQFAAEPSTVETIDGFGSTCHICELDINLASTFALNVNGSDGPVFVLTLALHILRQVSVPIALSFPSGGANAMSAMNLKEQV